MPIEDHYMLGGSIDKLQKMQKEDLHAYELLVDMLANLYDFAVGVHRSMKDTNESRQAVTDDFSSRIYLGAYAVDVFSRTKSSIDEINAAGFTYIYKEHPIYGKYLKDAEKKKKDLEKETIAEKAAAEKVRLRKHIVLQLHSKSLIMSLISRRHSRKKLSKISAKNMQKGGHQIPVSAATSS